MKFGLLNADVNTAQYAAALVAAGCELTLICADAAGVQASLPVDATVRRVDEWEEALACGADFVLVGAAGPESRRLEQLQRLVQEGLPVSSCIRRPRRRWPTLNSTCIVRRRT